MSDASDIWDPADLARLERRRGLRSKCLRRTVDLAIAVPALILTSPVWGVLFILVKRADRGPVLFVQVREGIDGREFGMVKFRTMYRDADVRLAGVIAEDPVRKQEWESSFKLDDDPRILPAIGSFMRRSSADELPNLLNVVRGEMTLVGPRPFPPYHLDSYPPHLRRLRRRVKPGLTGLWQVERGGLSSQTASDETYLRRTCARYDLSLALRTVPLLIRGKTHY